MTDTELIRRVAMEVMGWHYWEKYDDPPSFPRVFVNRQGGFEVVIAPQTKRTSFSPLSNLNHAFMVVEKMRENGWAVYIHSGKNYFAQFHNGHNWPCDGALNSNLGHSICLAALKALEVKDERG